MSFSNRTTYINAKGKRCQIYAYRQFLDLKINMDWVEYVDYASKQPNFPNGSPFVINEKIVFVPKGYASLLRLTEANLTDLTKLEISAHAQKIVSKCQKLLVNFSLFDQEVIDSLNNIQVYWKSLQIPTKTPPKSKHPKVGNLYKIFTKISNDNEFVNWDEFVEWSVKIPQETATRLFKFDPKLSHSPKNSYFLPIQTFNLFQVIRRFRGSYLEDDANYINSTRVQLTKIVSENKDPQLHGFFMEELNKWKA